MVIQIDFVSYCLYQPWMNAYYLDCSMFISVYLYRFLLRLNRYNKKFTLLSKSLNWCKMLWSYFINNWLPFGKLFRLSYFLVMDAVDLCMYVV